MWLFGGLALYLLAQFSWWTLLLLRRNAELERLRRDLEVAQGATIMSPPSHSGAIMVIGEAAVFLALLLLAVWLTYRAVRRDLRMASAQRNFLLAVTHELRTPITAVKLQLQTLARSGIDQTQRDSLLKTALGETDRLSALTDKVLLAAAGEEGLRIRAESIDVVRTVRSVLEQAQRTYAETHRLSLQSEQRLQVEVDPGVLRSVLENLIENAVKYSPEKSTIEVRLECDETFWSVVVSDEGPGVPEAERSRIFERFYRSGREEVREQPGTGLGLYIVKRLMDRCGGRITVSDRAPHGSIFTASFPRS